VNVATQSLHSSDRRAGPARKFLLPFLAVALPLVLLAGAIWMLRQVQEQRGLYLRSQAGHVAASLETLTAPEQAGVFVEGLFDETPGLRSVDILDSDYAGPDDGAVKAIYEGRQLFHAEEERQKDALVFRYYTPFHLGGELRVARIEMDARAADFLMQPAWTNVLLAAATAVVLFTLLLYVYWAERKAERLELERVQMEHLANLGKMSAVLAHEIRNPLGTIKGFTQLAEERADGVTKDYLGMVVEEILRLERLVQDLLLYGRPVEARAKRFRWNELAESVAAYAREAIGEKPVRFEYERSDLELTTDENLVKQVLLNLIRNSVEAMAEGGSLRLLAEVNGGKVEVKVYDDGPGIPAETKKRLFEPFFTTKASGSGLGLSICRKVADALGGEFQIRDGEPKGTVAVLRLPKELKHGTTADRG
jgi:two-component system sensor histidine kinase HydH